MRRRAQRVDAQVSWPLCGYYTMETAKCPPPFAKKKQILLKYLILGIKDEGKGLTTGEESGILTKLSGGGNGSGSRKKSAEAEKKS